MRTKNREKCRVFERPLLFFHAGYLKSDNFVKNVCVCSTFCAQIIKKFHWEGANLTREANQSIRRVGLRAARGGRIKGPGGK